MNLFDLPMKEFDKKIDEIFNQYTSKELLEELKKCGLEVNKDER